MSVIHVSRNHQIAAQQLAIERHNINANPSLTPEAKDWHIRIVERAFANAQYGQTLSLPARIAWAIATIPADLAWGFYNFPDILRFGMLGGGAGVVESAERFEGLAIEEEHDDYRG